MVFCITPQRTQSSRARSTPTAAETGSSVLDKSIQAHTFAACVIRERKESATEVRPEHSGPSSSLTAPTGSPPFKTSSSDSMPVAATGRIIFGVGVSAEGIFCARRFDLETDCGGGWHGEVSSPYMRLLVRRNVKYHCTIFSSYCLTSMR